MFSLQTSYVILCITAVDCPLEAPLAPPEPLVPKAGGPTPTLPCPLTGLEGCGGGGGEGTTLFTFE